MSAPTWMLVVLAGGAGSTLRLLADEAVRRRRSGTSGFPAGIFVVNVSGSFLFGLAGGALDGGTARVVMTGLLGGYTTFSTWMLDTHNALTAQRTAVAVANVVLSLAAGLAALHLGSALAG